MPLATLQWHAWYAPEMCTVCLQIVVTCLLTQMNYLNKSLDLFNTAIVSPIYYVMFTLLTIVASVIMFQVCPDATEAWDECGGVVWEDKGGQHK